MDEEILEFVYGENEKEIAIVLSNIYDAYVKATLSRIDRGSEEKVLEFYDWFVKVKNGKEL